MQEINFFPWRKLKKQRKLKYFYCSLACLFLVFNVFVALVSAYLHHKNTVITNNRRQVEKQLFELSDSTKEYRAMVSARQLSVNRASEIKSLRQGLLVLNNLLQFSHYSDFQLESWSMNASQIKFSGNINSNYSSKDYFQFMHDNLVTNSQAITQWSVKTEQGKDGLQAVMGMNEKGGNDDK